MRTGMGCIAALEGTMGIVVNVAAALGNIRALLPH